MNFKEWIKGKEKGDLIENISILTIVASAALIIVGVSVGTFISGVPVFLAILGSFLAVLGLVIYIFAEFYKILKKE